MATLQEEPIHFRTAGVVIVFFIVTLIALLFVFNGINWTRKQAVIHDYTNRHETFIKDGQNPAILQELLTTGMDECQKERNTQDTWPTSYSCQKGIGILNQLEKRMLENFSASAFARVRDGNIEFFEVSGQYHEPRAFRTSYELSYDTKEDLYKYAIEGKEIDRWQNFIGYLPGKEVVTPIGINGEVIGYIFQSVIEK